MSAERWAGASWAKLNTNSSQPQMSCARASLSRCLGPKPHASGVAGAASDRSNPARHSRARRPLPGPRAFAIVNQWSTNLAPDQAGVVARLFTLAAASTSVLLLARLQPVAGAGSGTLFLAAATTRWRNASARFVGELRRPSRVHFARRVLK